MPSRQLRTSERGNMRDVPVEPQVKSVKTCEMSLCGVRANVQTAKSADPSCYGSSSSTTNTQRSRAMTKNASEKLRQCEVSLRRWHMRLTRAANMVRKLEQQRQRLGKQLHWPAGRFLAEPVTTQAAKHEPAPSPMPSPAPAGGGSDGIPEFLRRTEATKRLGALPDPRTKEKKAERRAVEQEVRQAELTGKRRKMPLSG